MQDIILERLERRKNRAIRIILEFKENECDEFLPEGESFRFRKVILEQLNDLHDFCLDVLKSVSEDTIIVNDHWLQRIEEKLDYIYNLEIEEA